MRINFEIKSEQNNKRHVLNKRKMKEGIHSFSVLTFLFTPNFHFDIAHENFSVGIRQIDIRIRSFPNNFRISFAELDFWN